MIIIKNLIVICYQDGEMRLLATAIVGKFNCCAAIAWDKQTGKTYLLIQRPQWACNGDFNGDGKVDIKDILIVAKAYGSSVGSLNYDPNCDMNEDGKIDMKDICLAVKCLLSR